MTRIKDLFSVLVVSQRQELLQRLKNILDPSVYDPPYLAKSSEEARRKLFDQGYDLVILDQSLGDFALDIAENNISAVILLCRGDSFEELSYDLSPYGIMVVENDFSDAVMTTALNIAMSAHNRILKMEEENNRLRFKNEEMRLCNRAKWALHENLGMSENDAHRFIEKTAMNNRITRYAVAKNILKEYE